MQSNNKLFFTFALLTAIAVAVSLSLYSAGQIWQTASTASLIVSPAREVKNLKVSVLFVGDIMLDRGIRYYSEKNSPRGEAGGGNNFVFEKIHEELLKNDIVVANLEGPITSNDSVSVTAKLESPESYFFTFDPSWTKTLFENNIRLVSLGNNHILNFGGSGLASTKKYLSDAGIDYFGAPDYPKSITIEVKGIKLTFISYNEFSFYAKTEDRATIEEIQKAKDFSDIIIVFSHWGAEYTAEPPGSVKTLARQFIDAGADLVIGSHPHVIQPAEIYKGKRIYYSLGNFIFDQYFSEETKNGLGVILKIDVEKRRLEFEEINFYTQENGQTIIRD